VKSQGANGGETPVSDIANIVLEAIENGERRRHPADELPAGAESIDAAPAG
jgi:hypothetical protein